MSPRFRIGAGTPAFGVGGLSRSSFARALDWATVAVAVAIFALSFFTRREMANVVDADELLPVVLLALRFGRRGGLAGALVAVVLTGAWELSHGDSAVTFPGYLGRIAAFVATGMLVGMFVDGRRRAEARLIRYFDASLDLLATASQDGYFVRVNPAWEKALGRSRSELLSRPFIDFVHPDDREATRERVAMLRSGASDIANFRNRYLAADGEVHWLEWNARRSTRDGLIHATARDITTQVAAERQLESNARLLEEMVAERTAELEEARAETLTRLARAGEYRDDETFQHTERVGAVSAAIAAQLGLGHEQVELIREAAPLHDIGKLAISDSILLKPGPLTPEERREMETHAEIGARLLAGSHAPILNMASTIAASHHERWDGSGYPARLRGERIPLAGRIVAVADVFDALTHDRPYKQAWPAERALEEIGRLAGEQFDPRVVAAFLAAQRRDSAEGPGDGDPVEVAASAAAA